MKTHSKTVYFLSILGLSAVLFLSFCWTAAFSFYAAAWAQSAISIVVTLISIIAVIPGTVCYREKRNSVYTLSIIILVFLNTFVHWSWLEIYTRHHGFHIS